MLRARRRLGPANTTPKARDRLIDTARVLFVRHGIPNVGINEVIAEACVAKRSLYSHFASKTDLALAAYEMEAAARRGSIEAAQKACGQPLERLLTLFDVAETLANREGFRGCAFVNLAIETATGDGALHALARRHKDWIAGLVKREVRALHPKAKEERISELTEQIRLLWDGGIVGAYVHGTVAPIRAARSAVKVLLER